MRSLFWRPPPRLLSAGRRQDVRKRSPHWNARTDCVNGCPRHTSSTERGASVDENLRPPRAHGENRVAAAWAVEPREPPAHRPPSRSAGIDAKRDHPTGTGMKQSIEVSIRKFDIVVWRSAKKK